MAALLPQLGLLRLLFGVLWCLECGGAPELGFYRTWGSRRRTQVEGKLYRKSDECNIFLFLDCWRGRRKKLFIGFLPTGHFVSVLIFILADPFSLKN